MWRSLIRVEKITLNFVYVVIPSWNSEATVAIPLFSIPQAVRGLLVPGKRIHAKVNTNVDESADLCFTDWETE